MPNADQRAARFAAMAGRLVRRLRPRPAKPATMAARIGTREAARILGISQRQVQTLVDAGELVDVVRPGTPRGWLRLSRAEVELMAARRGR